GDSRARRGRLARRVLAALGRSRAAAAGTRTRAGRRRDDVGPARLTRDRSSLVRTLAGAPRRARCSADGMTIHASNPANARSVAAVRQLVGSTPLLEILYRHDGHDRRLYAKYESMNMTGSVKDR